MALLIVDELECLNKSIQKRTETIAGMREAIACVRSSIAKKKKQMRGLSRFLMRPLRRLMNLGKRK